MPAYVKQHYVPRFYLNYFATLKSQRHPNKKRWQIYVHNKGTGETTDVPPFIPEVAYGPWYYEHEDDERKFMEKDLARIETLAGEVVKKINETRDISWLTARDKKRLVDFVATQHVRVPKQRGMSYRSIIKRDFPGYSLRDDEAHLYVMMRFAVPLALYLFEIDNWELFENPTGVPLITSDSPVSTMPFEIPLPDASPKAKFFYIRAFMGLVDFYSHKPEDYPLLGFNIPLSPSLLLVMRPKQSMSTHFGISTEEEVGRLNELHVIQSYQQLYGSTPNFGELRLAKDASTHFHTELSHLEALGPDDFEPLGS